MSNTEGILEGKNKIMNREIKFRAWDEMYKKFIYSEPPIDMYIFWGSVLGGINAQRNVPVMQFTGLKDKNGKDIYEGDIVKWDDGSNGKYWRVAEVFYDSSEAMFSFRIIKNTMHELSCEEGYVFGSNFYYRDGNNLEMIGNIYENPELLNQQPVTNK